MLDSRVRETPDHLFTATGGLNWRYAWPVELALLLAVACAAPLVVRAVRAHSRLVRGAVSTSPVGKGGLEKPV